MDIRRTVDEIAALVGGRVEGTGARRVEALRGLDRAGPADMAVVFREGWIPRARASRAGCLVVAEDSGLAAGEARSLVRVTAPDAAVDSLVAAFAPAPEDAAPGIHPGAWVEAGAEVDASASVGPGVFVGAGARVGAQTRLDHAVHVGPGARIGRECRLHPGVVVGHGCELGDRVVIHAGTVLGADGFGFRPDASGHLTKVAQVGTVVIEDDVEIGANCTVDRARFDATVVGRNSKLDSQVLIAHNVTIGPDCALAGNVAVAGSVSIGAGVLMGGRSGATDGVIIGDRALIGGCAFVTKNVPASSYVAGVPARPHKSWLREMAALRRLPDLLDRARALGPAEDDGGA